jgi:MerR family transcriptional regulator, redox-sensitive transcriptional activator SoxR
MLTIGQVASQTGLRVSAIRYYESRGLLPKAPRASGKRVYSSSIVERLAVIELAKMAGLSLDEIRATLSAADGRALGARWKAVASAKRVELDEEMKRLTIAKYVLTRVSACSCASIEDCGRAFIDALSRRPPNPPMDATARRRRSAKRLRRRA